MCSLERGALITSRNQNTWAKIDRILLNAHPLNALYFVLRSSPPRDPLRAQALIRLQRICTVSLSASRPGVLCLLEPMRARARSCASGWSAFPLLYR